MRKFTKSLLALAMLFGVVGGVNSVKAETVKRYSTGLSGGGDVSYSDGVLSWTKTSNNVLTAIEFDAGLLSYFSKIKLTCSNLTEGASFRVIVVTKNSNNENVNFIKSVTTTGDVEISINELIQQWGANTMTEEQIAKATQLRIGGGSEGTCPASLTIDPTTICLETSWDSPMQINTSADWNGLSLLVKNGLPSLDAVMTADVNAGSTMVGTSTKPYQGTFDGAGHTLTFTYDGSTSNEIAPFQYVNNATINNLTTAGSINAQNIFGGIIGTAGGASTLNYCTSNMVLTANDNGDSNNGRVAGFVGRCADNATPVGTSITFNNCMFGGSISSTIDSRCCGLVSWARSTTVTANNCLIAPTSVTNGAENIAATGGTDPVVTPTNCYYTERFGGSSQGTLATTAQITSGELCYALNENSVPSTSYFFGQNLKALSSSPILTSNTAYKVYSLGGGEYANRINTIGSSDDWVLFSKLVAAGETDMDVTMTSDVNAGSTMVGSEVSGKRYKGTFDGAGHTLTFTYSGSSDKVAPFKAVDGATIKDLKTTGSITSTNNLLAGIVGQCYNDVTLTRCASDMSITTTHSDNGRIGGLVARCAETDASLTLNHCLFDGRLSSEQSGYAAGMVGWSAGNTVTATRCLVNPSSVKNGGNNFDANNGSGFTETSCYYVTKFGSSTQGTKLDDQLLNSGQAAWTLNQDIGDGAWFFGQGNVNASNIETYPTLTTDPSKKVVRTKASDTSTDLYVNPGGAVPNAVRMRATGFSMTDGGEVVTSIPSSFTTDDVVIYRTSTSFKFKVSAAGATTLIVPFNVAELPDGMTAYNLAFDGTSVTATPVSSITADKPVLINAPAGEYKFATGLTGTIEDYASRSTTNGSLTGVYNEAGSSSASNPLSYVPAGAYVLQNGEDGLGFYRVDVANTIKITSFRAYLTAGSGARSLRIIYADETDGINDATRIVNSEENAVYNLQGVRVAQPTKGLYIVNGKKMMVK